MERLHEVRLRWSGHRLGVSASVVTAPDLTVQQFHAHESPVVEAVRRDLPSVSTVVVSPRPVH